MAFKWLLHAVEHHESSVLFGIQCIVNGFGNNTKNNNFMDFVEHSTLADTYLNHSSNLHPQVIIYFNTVLHGIKNVRWLKKYFRENIDMDFIDLLDIR